MKVQIIPISTIEWPGLITSVVFFEGCNWRCPWCHNKDLVGEEKSVAAVVAELRSNKLIDGVVYSGGEPTLNPELKELCKAVHAMNRLNILFTNGSNPDVVKDLLLDGVSLDYKAPEEKFGEVTGSLDWDKFIETKELLEKSPISLMVRVTVSDLLTGSDVTRIYKDVKRCDYFIIQQCTGAHRSYETLREMAEGKKCWLCTEKGNEYFR